MSELIVDNEINLTDSELELKERILSMSEKFLFADVRYTDTEVAKKIKKEVCDRYDI